MASNPFDQFDAPAPDYDYDAARAAGVKQGPNGHWPDTYKLPNHITFSTDSKYSKPGQEGGTWSQADGKWHYKPSAFVLTQHSPEELKGYFGKNEPDSVLDLPAAQGANPFDQFDAAPAQPTQMENGMPVFPSMQGEETPGRPMSEAYDTLGKTASQYMSQLGQANTRAMTAKPSYGLGTAEAVTSLATGAIAPVLGTAESMALGTDPEKSFARYTYQPRTESGKAQLGYLGALMKPLTDSGADIALAPLALGESRALGAAPAKIPANARRTLAGRTPVSARAVEVAGAPAAGEAIPAATATAERAAGLANVPAAAEKTSAEVAREAGFVLKPSEAGGKAGALAEGLSGSAKLETAAIIKNSKRADALAAEEIGVKELKGGEFAKAREPHSAVYREVGQLGEVPAGPEYAAEIGNIGRAPGNSFAKAVNSEVEQLKQQYTVERFDAKDAVQETRELRFKARKNLKSQDPAKNELGVAQLKVSDAIENQLERQAAAVGKGNLVARFKSARVALAKINSVVGAMRNGRISPEILAKQLDAGVPLSGNLRTIAQVAKDYPNVMRNAAKLKGQSPLNMFETVVGLGGAATLNPGLLGAMVARPLTRAALLSERYQNALTRPKSRAAESASAPAAPKKVNALLEN
jgi:hypothetical protein